MKDDLKSRIDAILNRYETRTGEVIERREEERSFLEDFKALRDSTLRPVLEEIGNHLKTRGYGFQVSMQRDPKAGISMEVFPGGDDSVKVPLVRVRFTPKGYKKMVLMEGTSEISGRLDLQEFELAQMNEDLVEDYVVRVLEKAFR
jgi:hypothetical protein